MSLPHASDQCHGLVLATRAMHEHLAGTCMVCLAHGRVQVLASGKARLHDEQLAAAITRAWLALPDLIKRKGWPQWTGGEESTA